MDEGALILRADAIAAAAAHGEMIVTLTSQISFGLNPVVLGAAALLITLVLISFIPGAAPGSG